MEPTLSEQPPGLRRASQAFGDTSGWGGGLGEEGAIFNTVSPPRGILEASSGDHLGYLRPLLSSFAKMDRTSYLLVVA